MAPRSAKAKKTANVKLTENEGSKKIHGKNFEKQESEITESEVIEKDPPVLIKKKRGKKVANDTNGDKANTLKSEDITLQTKKAIKKNSEEENDNKINGDKSSEEESSSTDDIKQNGDINGGAEDTDMAKGRKKTQKKDVEAKIKESGRGTKNIKQEENVEDETKNIGVTEEEKLKSTSKGKGRKAAAKIENVPVVEKKTECVEEDINPEPAVVKGKKKGQNKAKEKVAESIKDVTEKNVAEEEQLEKVTKKKESKGKKNQGKKNQVVDTQEQEEEVHEEIIGDELKKETKKKESKAKKNQRKEEIDIQKEEDIKEEPVSKKRKTTKKEKGDVKDEVESVEDKPSKGKRGQKKAVESSVENEDEPQDTGEQATKRRRKQAEDKAPVAAKKSALKNKAATNYEEIDFSNFSKNKQGKDWNYKISSWNVDGIRAWLGKGGLEYLKYEKPDILCLQEVKCAQDKLPEELVNVPGYHAYWLCSDQDGYAGVGVYTSKLAMNVQYGLQNEDLDNEGRIITAEYEHFYLISTYVPNAGRKLVTLPKRLQWNEAFRNYVKELDKKKPVIICGDMNVAHNEIDLANPKTNKKNAGFTEEERAGMTDLLGDGFVDTFRHLYPDTKGAYTFWTYMMNSRAKNVGWRLDYFIVSERLLTSVCDSVIRDGVYGSDHCPISLFLHLSSAEKPK
ncbi:unnamed protein product [Diatraea saccharalis]|uniref:DNA-(apurinic or apyrimidinic site) endonuclease n=1 Tax=Diatraea saccharalis TaxID=40085 RepID=A0A9N9R7Z5_9NEOP|nr:unnamed protein product [Diatraea saccharalis]